MRPDRPRDLQVGKVIRISNEVVKTALPESAPGAMGAVSTTETRLRLSQAYNRSVIEACAAPIFVINDRLEICDVNESAVGLTRSSRAALVGTPLPQHIGMPLGEELVVQRAITTGDRAKLTLSASTPDGQARSIFAYASAFTAPGGERRGLLVASPD